MDVEIRRIEERDLSKVLEIAALSYTKEFYEDEEIYKMKRKLYPQGSLLLLCDGKEAGYLISHPAEEDVVYQLNNYSLAASGKENCMYLHDVTVHPDFRKKGLMGRLLEEFNKLTEKEGFRSQTLVAVQGSRPIWEKYGFSVVKEIEYSGKKAYYMKRTVE